MTKRIIIVHGWYGGPDKDWMPWVKREFEKLDCKVIIPNDQKKRFVSLKPSVGYSGI